MIRTFEIRQRRIEVATGSPGELAADALLLPWFQDSDPEAESTSVYPPGVATDAEGEDRGEHGPEPEHLQDLDPEIESALDLEIEASLAPEPESESEPGSHWVSEAILEEIADYRGEREVMLTSAGDLPVRFLFHLTLPEPQGVNPTLIEERFRDAFFQAGVLGLRVLALPILDFAPFTDRFPELVNAIWKACSEFLAREQGPQRLLFLVEDRDLRGQYLRHFLRRKEIEDLSWQGDSERNRLSPVLPVPALSSARNRATREAGLGGERVLGLEGVECEALASGLKAFLGAQGRGEDPDAARNELMGALSAILRAELAENGVELESLPQRLRVLGANTILDQPWELVPMDDGLLGESRLLLRGTSFLHFSRTRGRTAASREGLGLRLLGEESTTRGRRRELEALAYESELILDWDRPEASPLVHCLDSSGLATLMDDVSRPCELLILESSAGDTCASDDALAGIPAETAIHLLARGCRRVLASLAPFGRDEERRLFLGALYGALFAGDEVGRALLLAQAALREKFGADCGWYLYHLFGQAEGALLPRAGADARREGWVSPV